MPKQTVDSRWWYGNALTVGFAVVMIAAALLNMAVGGSAVTASLLIFLVGLTFIVGYASVITFYLDVRKVRKQSDYNPAAWFYVLGYILLSPVLVSVVYLVQRHRRVETFGRI